MARTISTYDEVPHAALALFAGPDIGVFGRSYLAHILWHLGFPERASAAVQDALARPDMAKLATLDCSRPASRRSA